MDDLAQLRDLSESALVKQLSSRFGNDDIYTYIGDILVACNPYRDLGLYTQEVRDKYKGRIPRSLQPPHVYYVANYAYERMMQTKTDQSFVISGESGAGKTETTKHIIRHTMEVCKAGKTTLETNILRLNPLLEAFGNAQTAMNDNSSRFGKYISLNFDRSGAILGANLTTYLLEKSRVTHLQPNESNYHIFYYLLEGMAEEQRRERNLKAVKQHAYVRGTSHSRHHHSMEEAFNGVLNMMTRFGFDSTEMDALFDVIAAILHIGDISFDPAANDGSCVSSASLPSLAAAANLLGLDNKQLTDVLTTSVTNTRGEEIVRLHAPTAAADARDSTAKSLYSRCFAWLVSSLNDTLACDPSVGHLRACNMGVLDIFGFEHFEENSLEQLCINITNENLQWFFNHHIFEMEAAAYEEEGVDGTTFSYPDNQPIISLCTGRSGILSILNEECRLPQGSDGGFVSKCTEQLASHASKALKAPRSSKDLHFSVRHFAGEVKYTCHGFVEKNKDRLADSVVPTLMCSRSEFLIALYTAQRDMASGFKVISKRRQSRFMRRPKANLATLSSFFQKSLEELMASLHRTMPHFVRCIKPNTEKKPKTFNSKAVVRQLKYAGVLETVRIRQAGFAVRMPFEEFCKHYRIIVCKAHEAAATDADTANKIVELAGLKGYRMGKSKIFLRYHHLDQLQVVVRRHAAALTFVRKVCKGFIARHRYRALLDVKRRTLDMVVSLLAACEACGDRVEAANARLCVQDEAQKQKRDFLKKVKEEEEALKQRAEEDAQRAAEAEEEMAALDTDENRTRTKMADGGYVWTRNENLTLRVGNLPPHWEKKMDQATGRVYFKNHRSKETTWIDPRSAVVRKLDARETVGNELPYGWDEAETADGVPYYINHTTKTTHWLHPRVLLDQKREEYERLQQGVNARANVHRGAIAEFRKKRRVLDVVLEETVDDEERAGVQDRITAMERAIDTELEKLNEVLQTNDELRREIKKLKTQFDRREHEAKHGLGTYDEGDVEDLYAIDRSIDGTMPRKLDPVVKQRLSMHALQQVEPPKEYTDTMRKGFFGTLFGRRKRSKGKKKDKQKKLSRAE